MLKSVCDIEARPGEVVYGALEFEDHRLPAFIAQGRSAGPTLLVTGLQHPTEFSGPAALDRARCFLR